VDLLLPVDTNVDNGAAYVNPSFQHGSASSSTGETAPGNNDTSYDFVTGALAMMQGTSGADPDHAALVNATYAGRVPGGRQIRCCDWQHERHSVLFRSCNLLRIGRQYRSCRGWIRWYGRCRSNLRRFERFGMLRRGLYGPGVPFGRAPMSSAQPGVRP
jgi:hypothetical protein